VLVATRYGRQGIGRRLVAHALGEAGETTTFLYATEQGRPLYERLGFVVIGMTQTHVGRFVAPAAPPASRPARPADLPAIAGLDTEVNGVDRADVVERLPAFTEQLRVIERHGVISGYAGAWRDVENVVVGPVVAATVDDAKALITDLAKAIDGPVRLDLDDRYPRLREWATQRGIVARELTTVMVRGGTRLPGDRSRWFIPVTQALG
jgi:hypothetical protein